MIRQSDVDRYVRVRALMSRYAKESNTLHDKLLSQLGQGFNSPRKGPFLVVRATSDKPNFGWKEMAEALAEKLKAQPLLNQLVKAAGRRQEERLEIVANPAWGKKKKKR